MKKAKQLLTLLIVLAIGIMIPMNRGNLVARAEEGPTTFYVKYVPEDDDWRIQYGTWVDGGYDRELYYMTAYIKNGDTVVIDASGKQNFNISFDVNLENLTVVAGTAIVTAKSINECFVLSGTTTVVNGNVTNAYVYDYGLGNFNNDVKNLNVIGTGEKLHAIVGTGGVVSHVKAYDKEGIYYEIYDVKKGMLSIEDGVLQTEKKYYSTTPAASGTGAATTAKGFSDIFSADYYAEKNSDLAAAGVKGATKLLNHAMTTGIKEGRDVSPILDVAAYRAAYSDLDAAFGDNWDAYVKHYLTSGIRERRTAGVKFSLVNYEEKYSDVKAAFGDDYAAVARHYLNYGIKEGRTDER